MALPTPATPVRTLGRPRLLSSGQAALSLWTLAVRALTRHRVMALAQGIAMTLALAVPLSLRLVGDGATQAGYQSLLGSGSSIVTIEQPWIADQKSLGYFQEQTATLVEGQVGGDLQLLTTFARAGTFRINTLNGKASPGDANLTGAYYPDLLTHATLVNGAWPDGKGQLSPIPVTLSRSGAVQAGLTVGDVACVGTASTPTAKSWCLKLIGTWQPLKPSDPYWQSGPSNTDINLSAADYFQFLAAANRATDDVFYRAGRVYHPDAARFTMARAPALAGGLTQLRAQVEIRQSGRFYHPTRLHDPDFSGEDPSQRIPDPAGRGQPSAGRGLRVGTVKPGVLRFAAPTVSSVEDKGRAPRVPGRLPLTSGGHLARAGSPGCGRPGARRHGGAPQQGNRDLGTSECRCRHRDPGTRQRPRDCADRRSRIDSQVHPSKRHRDAEIFCSALAGGLVALAEFGPGACAPCHSTSR